MLRKDNPLMAHVHRDQVYMVYGNAPLSLIASLINSVILVYLLWPVLDSSLLTIWISVTCLISLFRLYLSYRFHKVQPEESNIDSWSAWALVGALLAGLGWGAASYFLFAVESLPHQVFLAFVIAGTVAGAVASLSARRLAIKGFILLATLPLAYRFFQASHEFAVGMGVMVILFTLLTVIVARRFHNNLTDMLIERYQRRRAQQRDRARSQVLELLSKGAPLEQILQTIIRDVERDNPQMLCSILLLDEDGKRLLFGAAPSLPNTFNVYVHGLEVGPEKGSCGAAAFTRQRVIAEDLQTHPSWINCRELVDKEGLRSCWSEPIFSSNERLLGTFAVYHRHPHLPDEQELSAIKHAVKLGGISIERNQTGEALRLAASIYQNTSEAMMITDENNKIVAINPAFTEVTGYREDEVLGKDPRMLASGSHDEEFFQSMWNTLKTTGGWQGEIWNRRKNGDEFVEWLTINTIYDIQGDVYRRVSLFSDITDRKKADALIWRQANYDTLTQLPNRRLFTDRLEQGTKIARREGLHLALLFLDLDRFKEVNDTLGHHVGDELLVDAARRIKSCVRESDTVARLGGDEFTVILNELHDLSCIGSISQKIIDTMAKPFQLRDEQIFISASIGITVYPEDGLLSEELLKNADQAMFAAKQNGRNRINYFTKSMQESAQNRMRLVRDIHQALEEDQFSVHYQPIISLSTGRILKAEALLRWNHPEYGFISPADFIPVAEETGAIQEIGNQVFEEVVKRIKVWRLDYEPEFQININKSPVQFLAGGSVQDNWLEYLQQQNVSPKGVVIEITEGVLLKATSYVCDKLHHLRDAGIQIAIDDFGTGYSSLAYLKRFDIDYLKLDKSFVRNLETDAKDLALSEAIIVMAHKLDIHVVAEGVENKAQRAILKRIGCDYAQGFLIAKPMPADEFELLLQNESSKVKYA
jgi:diguanylate cyclase (GGDEF)-like protein/PAS domain S-box-containing protein